jgi:hypothetical protein
MTIEIGRQMTVAVKRPLTQSGLLSVCLLITSEKMLTRGALELLSDGLMTLLT